MWEGMVFRSDGRRLVWETDSARAQRGGRFNRRLGLGLIVLGVVILVIFPIAFLVTLALVFFGVAALRHGCRLSRERWLVAVDADAGQVLRRHDPGSGSAAAKSWPLAGVTAVALTWRTSMTITRSVPQGRRAMHDLCIRLVGEAGGMSLERFRCDQAEAAQARASAVAELLQRPLIRQSVRRDGFLFQHAPYQTSEGPAAHADERLYVRDLGADEADDRQDRVVPRDSWRLLAEPADLLAVPDTSFFS